MRLFELVRRGAGAVYTQRESPPKEQLVELWDDARVISVAHHGVCLAAPCLTIGKHGAIVASQGLAHQGLCQGLEQFLWGSKVGVREGGQSGVQSLIHLVQSQCQSCDRM